MKNEEFRIVLRKYALPLALCAMLEKDLSIIIILIWENKDVSETMKYWNADDADNYGISVDYYQETSIQKLEKLYLTKRRREKETERTSKEQELIL
jgi:hypothetical protein